MKVHQVPNRLYRYRAFNTHTLRLLSEVEVYYADPTKFNDPLFDCNPTIQVDVDRATLEKLCYRMLTMSVGKDRAKWEIHNYRYLSTEYENYKTDPAVEDCYMRMLTSEIKRLVHQEFGRQGVLSFSQHWDCPLMWSHYADDHRGLCLEYDLSDSTCAGIAQVRYSSPRRIKISDLVEWKLNSSSTGKEVVTSTYFFSKAPQWRYEKEWRFISANAGSSPAPH